MSLEIELKLRVASHEPVRERLRAAGAAFCDRVVESNAIFDRSDGSLRQQGCGLRIRALKAEDDAERPATLTFKGPRLPGPMKSREEFEVQISDPETTTRMLRMLGFVRVLSYEKQRESWELGRCRIELDVPPHLGRFVEIEGPDEGAIRVVQGKLGLADAEVVRESYVRMLWEYCDRHGVTERVLRLPQTTES